MINNTLREISFPEVVPGRSGPRPELLLADFSFIPDQLLIKSCIPCSFSLGNICTPSGAWPDPASQSDVTGNRETTPIFNNFRFITAPWTNQHVIRMFHALVKVFWLSHLDLHSSLISVCSRVLPGNRYFWAYADHFSSFMKTV
jgi:hypothetical protein